MKFTSSLVLLSSLAVVLAAPMAENAKREADPQHAFRTAVAYKRENGDEKREADPQHAFRTAVAYKREEDDEKRGADPQHAFRTAVAY
ncbi:hypothetical protein F4778DRAFT_278467 [Xylariomycetidae sp. FL2044]|nr:hypothetical protein F4778DRAFT_278467 [Xylariomycetidae sp. FL2044]